MIMGYILIEPDTARAKGLEYFETLPDGRAILDFSYLKVLGSMGQVEVIGSASELQTLIKEQKTSGLYDIPEDKLIEETIEEPTGEAIAVPKDTLDSGTVTEEGGEE